MPAVNFCAMSGRARTAAASAAAPNYFFVNAVVGNISGGFLTKGSMPPGLSHPK